MRRGGAVSWVPSRRLLPCRAFVTDLCGVNAAGQQTRCVCIRENQMVKAFAAKSLIVNHVMWLKLAVINHQNYWEWLVTIPPIYSC